MTVVGSYEAKTHLTQLIERARKGETIQITRHGVPVAQLMPVGTKTVTSEVIRDLRQFRKGKRLNGVSVKDMISEGRE